MGGAGKVAVDDGRESLDVGTEDFGHGLLLGFAQLGEFLGHMRHRAVMLTDLDTVERTLHPGGGGRIPGDAQRVGDPVGGSLDVVGVRTGGRLDVGEDGVDARAGESHDGLVTAELAQLAHRRRSQVVVGVLQLRAARGSELKALGGSAPALLLPRGRGFGFGIAGIVGALSLFLFFAGHLAVNLAGLEELLIFALGVVLIVVEVFFIPGFGLAGVVGAIFIGLSLILALVGMKIQIAWDIGLLADAFQSFALAVVGAAVAFALSLRFLPNVGPVRRLVLTETIKDDEQHKADRTSLPGQEGVTITPLRPGGKARIGERKLDVVTANEFIEQGERIRVLQVDGPRITVERIADEEGDNDVQ